MLYLALLVGEKVAGCGDFLPEESGMCLRHVVAGRLSE